MVPEVLKDEVVIHVIDLDVTFLVPAKLPVDQSRNDYVDVAKSVSFTPGEALSVVQTYTSFGEVSRKNFTGASRWQAYWTWLDGYKLQRGNGETFKVSRYGLLADRPCTADERCYSSTFFPEPGQSVYVSPFNTTDNGTLWLLSQYPAVQLTAKDNALIAKRTNLGEVDVITGTVTGIYVDGKQKLIGLDGGRHLNLGANYMPPVGTLVAAWVYKDTTKTPYGPYGWNVMALINLRGGLAWYVNTDVEYGQGFSVLWYGRDH